MERDSLMLMTSSIAGVVVLCITSLLVTFLISAHYDFRHVKGQSDDLERKQTIYAVVENALAFQYEIFIDKAHAAPDAMTSEGALNAANKISSLDPVELTNDIFEREQLKGEVLDNKSITSEVALIVMDEVVTGGPSFRNLLP